MYDIFVHEIIYLKKNLYYVIVKRFNMSVLLTILYFIF